MKQVHLIWLFFALLIFISCKKELEPDPIDPVIPKVAPGSEVALAWGKMTLEIMDKQAGNTPTYGSRSLGYMGLTMYETVVNGSPEYQSLSGQLSDMPALPKPQRGVVTNYEIALNASQAAMLKHMYYFAPAEKHMRIDSLENALFAGKKVGLNQEVIDRSVVYGKAVAEAIFEWSKKDGGYEGNKVNFDPTYMFPSGPGKWVPPFAGQVVSNYPLHPHWGKNRTFSPGNMAIPIPAMVPYSDLQDSEYYKLFYDVYVKNLTLSAQEREIAAWWGDDPTETWSPPGHSYSIANQIIAKEKPNIFKAAETYARVGMAVADAFINCWKSKYNYHCERPSTYIRRNINATFIQYWPEPPFPAFYSGHSVQGSASATVLEDIYGKNYAFVDNTHLGRKRDFERNVEFKPRTFNSLWEAAEESAMSRFYGGIHTKLDNEIGLAEGKKIGANINKLKWKR